MSKVYLNLAPMRYILFSLSNWNWLICLAVQAIYSGSYLYGYKYNIHPHHLQKYGMQSSQLHQDNGKSLSDKDDDKSNGAEDGVSL